MEHTLKAWLADNSITTDNKEDEILLPETVGNAVLFDIYRLMKVEDTELLYYVHLPVSAHGGTVGAKRISSQHRSLLYATPKLRGVVEQGKWNPETNSIYVSLT